MKDLIQFSRNGLRGVFVLNKQTAFLLLYCYTDFRLLSEKKNVACRFNSEENPSVSFILKRWGETGEKKVKEITTQEIILGYLVKICGRGSPLHSHVLLVILLALE